MGRIAVRPGRRVLVGWAATVAAGLPAVPVAADSNYVGGEGVGNWSTPTNWSPVGVPGSGSANFINSDGLTRTLNYDYAGPAVKLNGVGVDQQGTGRSTLLITGSSLTTKQTTVGYLGSGGIRQTGGTHAPDFLWVAANAKSRGTYELSGGELGGVTTKETIGEGGTGLFVHTGGTNTVDTLYVGHLSGSSGTYQLSGSGALTVATRAEIGGQSALQGVFEQSGGTHTAKWFLLGGGSGKGTYRLSGEGRLTVSVSEDVWSGGTFEQTGGTNTTNGTLGIGGSATSPAVYTMSAGTLTATTLTVGGPSSSLQTTGTFDLSGGTATIAKSVMVGRAGGVLNLSGGSLTAASVQNDGAVNVTGGTFSLALVNGGTVRASTGAVLTVTGGISGSNAASTAVSRLVVETGAMVVASYVRQGALELNGSTANPPPAPVLSIRSKAQGGATSVVKTLAIQTDSQGAPLGRVDLADTALVVDYAPGASPISTIRNLIAAGRAGGAWTGNGLGSSVAASSNGAGALGYGEASAVLGASGGTFGGQTVDGTAVLVRYTLAGDASLGGTVNFDDLLALAKHYNATNAQWGDGDFNYDGVVDFDDLLLLAKNYGQVAPTEPVAGAPAGFEADLAAAFAAVPEPGTVAWVAVAGLGLARRRRRRSAAGGGGWRRDRLGVGV